MQDQETNGYQLARSIGLKYGGWLGLGLGAVTIVLYAVDAFSNQWEIGVSVPAMLLIMLAAMLTFRKSNGGFMTLGQGFRVGLTTAVMAALVNTVMTQIYTQMIDTEATQRALDRSSQRMLQAGESVDRVSLYVQFMEKLAPPHIAIAATLITVAFFGAIAALILGMLLKQNPRQ